MLWKKNSVEEMEKTVLFRVQPHSAQSLETAMKSSRAIAVVDPFSTGAVLAYELSQKGFKVYAGNKLFHHKKFFWLVILGII